MSKGKKFEQKLVRRLRSVGLTAERVPRSVADAMPGVIDDIVVVPDGWPTADHDHRPITRRLQQLDDPEAYMEAMSGIRKIECKYTSQGAYGVSGLLDHHKRTVGLGTPRPVLWSGHDPSVYTGGLAAFATAFEFGAGAAEPWESDDTLAGGTVGLLEDAHGAAIRASREPWVLVWEDLS